MSYPRGYNMPTQKELAAKEREEQERQETGGERAQPAHVLHGQSGNGQNHRRPARGRDAEPHGLPGQGPLTRDDLVGQYIGHTAPKTNEVLKRAMGGVLFIDEAYYLYRAENERDYGQETIEILLQIMENNRDDRSLASPTAAVSATPWSGPGSARPPASSGTTTTT